MKTEIQKLPRSLVEIKGGISAEEFESYVRKSIEEYNRETEIPGFRRGLTPEKILLEKISEDKILERAAKICFQNFYPRALEENKIEPIGLPQFNVLKLARHNPLEFKIIVATVPEFKLPDYKKIAKDVFGSKEEIRIEEKEIEERLGQLKNMLESRSGKKEELNDEFAKKFGEFKNLAELKNVISQNLDFEKKKKEQDKKRIEAMEKILKETRIEVPEVLVEGEKVKMIEGLKKSVAEMGLKWEDYLKQLKKSERELLESFREEAFRRVNFGLILREIAEQEKIEVGEEEVGKLVESYEKLYPNEKISREYIYGLLKNEKTFVLLEKTN